MNDNYIGKNIKKIMEHCDVTPEAPYIITEVYSAKERLFLGRFENPSLMEHNKWYKIWGKDGNLSGVHHVNYLGKKTVCGLVSNVMKETAYESPIDFLANVVAQTLI
jgi:hypothetical protein